MNTIFGEITQPFIKITVLKKHKYVSIINFLWYKRENPKKYFRVLSCVIYTIIESYLYIVCLAFQSKH